MKIRFIAMPTDDAEGFREGRLDAYGNPPEQTLSDGGGNPCRHCLNDIKKDKSMLVLSYRPFNELQPYAETGPVLLCGDGCQRFAETDQLPPSIDIRDEFMIRGYSKDEKIVEGTGGIVATVDLMKKAEAMVALPEVEAVHIRSATNNCYFCKLVAE